jgi:hypothetical protein
VQESTCHQCGTRIGLSEDNGAFIAAASPDVVLALLDQLSAMTAARDELARVAESELRQRMETLRHIESTCEDDGTLRKAKESIDDAGLLRHRIVSLRKVGGKARNPSRSRSRPAAARRRRDRQLRTHRRFLSSQ